VTEKYTVYGGHVRTDDRSQGRPLELAVTGDLEVSPTRLTDTESWELARWLLRQTLEPNDWRRVRSAMERTRFQMYEDQALINEIRSTQGDES
jgi:hypothetical protein